MLELINLKKSFGEVDAVKNFSLSVGDGEFVVLLGPSGCGKTTVLRLIAGLERADNGDIILDGQKINAFSPRERDIAMVFQQYALYPHRTVYGNLAYPLQIRKFSNSEIEHRVKDIALLVGIEKLLDRKPDQLSGGEIQRVALGRAIIRHPKVYLMDEPLASLDAKLRMRMRSEIKRLHRQLQIKTIFVTHDQEEAMTLGDRIAIMKEGTLQQVGSAKEVYHNPQNLFVAEFIGKPSINILNVSLFFHQETVKAEVDDFHFAFPPSIGKELVRLNRKEVIVGFRPESIEVRPAGSAQSPLGDESKLRFELKIDMIESIEPDAFLHFQIAHRNIIARVQSNSFGHFDNPCSLAIPLNKLFFFIPETGDRIAL